MGEEKPLVMEVKIFDPEGRGYDRLICGADFDRLTIIATITIRRWGIWSYSTAQT
jgi:hypothetical protein